MANLIYLTLKGKKQGLISSGCSSLDSIGNKCQTDHANEILIYSLSHSLTREQNSSRHPVIIQKYIDKSSPHNPERQCPSHYFWHSRKIKKYGEIRKIKQNYLEGDDNWQVVGKSWHWQPVQMDDEYEFQK
ncbi:hypothetical protein B7R74_02860 [Yersinia pseudotuberculosis]|uniref:Hemolysin-coregulated protein n=1 Tax=Yersinia pseudotuberculosis TaxID=633 RepID=A0A380Q5Y0_YERPU|nr:type VI secretion system tube protein TssD [Yersinia pseudotuberculosis]PSH23591.1 hypothetical protein B7R74_02860 [Yersinia pseudotuberculosis]SUP81190.1 hemolysin-coregulated protein [Yersinia pseudotuberculosis]